MTAWTALGALTLAGVLTAAWLRLRSVSRSLDRHFATAQTVANPCQCRGSLHAASGVHHDPVCCFPRRELIVKRGAR